MPGFATDILGFLFIFPLTRKIILEKFLKKFKRKEEVKRTNKFIDGEYEDIEEDDDKKI